MMMGIWAVYDLRIFVWWPDRATMAQNQVSRVQVLVANIGIFAQTLKKVLSFLVAKSGYQQPKSGSLGLPGYH